MSTILWSFGIWSKLERWRSSVSACPHELTSNQRGCYFEVSFSLIPSNKHKPFLNQIVTWKVDCIQQLATISSMAGPRRSSKVLPKAKLAPYKGSWSLFGGLLPFWSTTAFWIPEKPLDLISMLSKSMRYTENCNTCSQHWSTERTQFITTMPNHLSHNQYLKNCTNWATTFLPHLPYSPDFLSTNYHCFKYLDNFLQGKHFHNQQDAENAFQKFAESWSMDFYGTGINKLISCWQKCVAVVPIFINKELVETS